MSTHCRRRAIRGDRREGSLLPPDAKQAYPSASSERTPRAAGATRHPTDDVTALRVVLYGDMLLTREALERAIRSKGVAIQADSIPHGGQELNTTLRSAEQFGAQVGIIVQERFSPATVADSERLLRRESSVHWMVLTGCAPGPYWNALMAAGAQTVHQLDLGLDALIEVLQGVAKGEFVMDSAIRVLLGRRDSGERAALEHMMRLSPREVEVLAQLAQGKSVAHLAAIQEVSEETIRSHVRGILRKLEVTSQLAAVAEWARASKGWPTSRGW